MERVAIIGGGIVGIALARSLVRRDVEVVVFEKEGRLAAHQSGHNSGVVHAGLYYPPGSLKAILCARGRRLTLEYCLEKGLPYRAAGKLVVAVDDTEMGALAAIEKRSIANEVPGLKRLNGRGLRQIEPHVLGVGGLYSPHTAVVDYVAITEAMAQDVRAGGGQVLLGHEVRALVQERNGVRVVAGAADQVFDRAIACAGLHSDAVAALVGADPSPRILPFRGEYWELEPSRAELVRGLIYPVPDPRFPFLGVHFTRGVYGNVHVGPSAVPALAREGYDWRTISLRDTWGSVTWPGAAVLARRHWRMGIKEISSSLLKRIYFQDARRFMPELTMSDLVHKVRAGVRAQAWARDGALIDDFVIEQVGSVTLLRNAPSPAATSSMAIADYVLDNHVMC